MRFFSIVMCLLFPFLAYADIDPVEPHSSSVIFLPSTAVHDGNYYAMGSKVSISGKVLGDLYVLASQALIEGEVHGDVIIACATAQITGLVHGNVRALGGQVTISGDVKRNMTILAGDFQLDKGAAISGNALCIAGNADYRGSVGHTLKIMASNLRLSGHFGGVVDAIVGKMQVTGKSYFASDLDYHSSEQALIDPEAKIEGSLSYHPSFLERNVKQQWIQKLALGSQVIGILMNFIFCLLIAALFKKLYPTQFNNMIEIAKKKPLSAMVNGLLIVVILPIVCLVFLVTVLGAPFAIALVGLNVLGFYSAKIFSVMAVSDVIMKKLHLKLSPLLLLSLGLICYFAITAIPYIGTIVAFTMMLIGMGTSVMSYQEDKPSFFRWKR